MHFPWKSNESSQKSRDFSQNGVSVNSLCFVQEENPEFRKVPHVREPACESAIVWFGLPGPGIGQCLVCLGKC